MVDCSKVYIDTSTFSTPDNKFSGAFASIDIKQGELIESGIVRRINDKSFNGMNCPHVFTWSDKIPNTTWAICSGCAMFYNTGLMNSTNTYMKRYFDEDRFEIYAKRDIKKGEELTHTYKSLEWRDVFKPLYDNLIL
tara:strand:- start:138 stop:548 length:411 start_codon:yes stop_codon:yes gene_type:complete